MPYEKKANKIFRYPLDHVYQSTIFCVNYMGGKIIKQDQEKGILFAQMDKKLFGKYLGDRSQLEIQFRDEGNSQTSMYIFAYPLNAVGQKLMFGAREGVVDTIISTLYQEMEKHLQDTYPS
ncbi:MAG TPA: hypothetical protein DCK95_09080 [Anaerolineaceae bacterium]|nr:hypothetical protein [Anaerolineaceae bacterium]